MHLFTSDDRATPLKLAGVAIGFAGVVVLMAPTGGEFGEAPLWAVGACLGAAISYGFAWLWVAAVPRRWACRAMVNRMGAVTCTTVLVAPLVLLIDRPWLLDMPSATASPGSGPRLISTALAYVRFFRIPRQRRPEQSRARHLPHSRDRDPARLAVLGERLAWTHFAGHGLIVAGLAAIDGRLVKRG